MNSNTRYHLLHFHFQPSKGYRGHQFPVLREPTQWKPEQSIELRFLSRAHAVLKTQGFEMSFHMKRRAVFIGGCYVHFTLLGFKAKDKKNIPREARWAAQILARTNRLLMLPGGGTIQLLSSRGHAMTLSQHSNTLDEYLTTRVLSRIAA